VHDNGLADPAEAMAGNLHQILVAVMPSSASTGPCAVLLGEITSTATIAVSDSLESRCTQWR
jgi:vacuolar-type H+-ATPase subunit B/Vma2